MFTVGDELFRVGDELLTVATLGRAHVCNDIPCDIPEHDPPRTYVRTYIYFARIDP